MSDDYQVNKGTTQPEVNAFYTELLELDKHLRSKGASLRGVIEHVAKNAFGVTVDLPHADTKAHREKIATETRVKAEAERDRLDAEKQTRIDRIKAKFEYDRQQGEPQATV